MGIFNTVIMGSGGGTPARKTGQGKIEWKSYLPKATFYGACQQDGTPTQSAPVPIKFNNSKWTTPVWNQYMRPMSTANYSSYAPSGVYSFEDDGQNRIKITVNEIYAPAGVITLKTKMVSLANRKYFIYFGVITDYDTTFAIRIRDAVVGLQTISANVNSGYEKIITTVNAGNTNDFIIVKQSTFTVGQIIHISNYMVFDLTQLFGAGNEPTTVEEFKRWAEANGYDLSTYQAYNTGTPIGGTVDLTRLPNGGLYGVGDEKDEWDCVSGNGIRKCGKIDSYSGEEVGDNWISTTGELSTGATVVYALQEETPFTAIPQPRAITATGQIWQQSGDIENTTVAIDYIPSTEQPLENLALMAEQEYSSLLNAIYNE